MVWVFVVVVVFQWKTNHTRLTRARGHVPAVDGVAVDITVLVFDVCERCLRGG